MKFKESFELSFFYSILFVYKIFNIMTTIKIYKLTDLYNMQTCNYERQIGECSFADTDYKGQRAYSSYYESKGYIVRKSHEEE